ncbi:MAG: MATE family efflux transporter, partial [Oscillospiraceae bacterium]|nr:MATE family efflux transporter [Oscillospiraceae bacterium]
MISRLIGSGKQRDFPKAAGTAVLSSVIFGVILAALGELVSKPLLALINTPEEIFSDALTYLRIYILFVPFLLIYDFGAAIFRSDGNSRTPLFILLVSGGINVVLNLIFVILLRMNVTGVAAATVISTALSAGAVLFLLVRESS